MAKSERQLALKELRKEKKRLTKEHNRLLRSLKNCYSDEACAAIRNDIVYTKGMLSKVEARITYLELKSDDE